MRIIMYPSPTRRVFNPIIHVLGVGLKAAGVSILPISAGGLWFPAALHVHWLEHVFWGRVARRVPVVGNFRAWHLIHVARGVRRRGGRVVWTLHNLKPHEAPTGAQARAWQLMTTQFLPLVTDVVVMSHDAVDRLADAFPEVAGARCHVIPHPDFRDFYEEHGLELRNPTAPNAVPTFAMVGLLRPYKGILEAIELLKARAETPFHLIIAGPGPVTYAQSIVDAIGGDPRFEFIHSEISHAQFAQVLRRSDAALFNFRQILNSGSVIAALSCGTPVICPGDGALAELAAQVGQDWVHCFERPLDVDWLLSQIASLQAMDRTAPPLDHLAPLAIGKALLRLYGEKR